MRNVCIIGATGIIGGYLSKHIKALTPTKKECNITNSESVSKYIEDKNIDVWINCAGIRGVKTKKQTKLRQIMLDGFILSTDIVAKYMSKNRGGLIINFGSMHGVEKIDYRKFESKRNIMYYSTIKAGIIHFSQCMSKYYDNVRVNCISCASVDKSELLRSQVLSAIKEMMGNNVNGRNYIIK